MTGRRRTLACAVAALGTASGLAAPAIFAQSPSTEAKEGAALEEIVVTARKREELLRDIPTSIDAFTGDRLEALGYNTAEDVVKLSPGVTLETGFSPSSTSIAFRGITNDSRSVGPRSVGRIYGNVPLTNPSIMGVEPDLDTFDMRSVEVLKGPQGTLFGGSALAGAIRYVPNSPDLSQFYGSASAGFGDTASSGDTAYNYSLMLNMPLGDAFALRFAGSIRDSAGFIDDTRNGERDINGYKTEQGRLIAKWQVVENLSIEGQYLTFAGDSDAFNWIEGKEPVRLRTKRQVDDFETTDVELFGVRFDWDLGPMSAVFEANRLEMDRAQLNDVTTFVGLFGTGTVVGQNFFETTDQDSYELRVVSNTPTPGTGFFGNWHYTAGLFFMDSDQTRPVIVNLNFPTRRVQQGGGVLVGAEEKAFYFDLTKLINERFEVNLGGRYFDQVTEGGTYFGFNYASDVPPGLPDQISHIPNVAGFLKLEDSGFNPKAAIRWFATDHVTVVGSYAQGYRFGGINGDKFQLDAAIAAGGDLPFTFGSDELENWEFGIRTTWLNRRLTADITAFYIDWKDLQVPQRAGIFAYTDNVGGAEVKGVEFALNASVTDDFSVLINGSYQNAETTVAFVSGQFGPIPAGTTLPQAPDWTGAIQLRYARDHADYSTAGTMTYSYRSSSTNNFVNSVPLDGYGTLDASISAQATSMSLKPRLSLIAKNITDESEAIFGFSLGGSDAISLIQPRTVGLKLDLHF